MAACIVADRSGSTVFRSVLECSLPHSTWGQAVEPAVVAAAHRAAWDASRDTGGAWIHAFLAEPLMDVEGEIAWQERLGEQGTSHPSIAQFAKVLAPLKDGRLARAKQFLMACLVRAVYAPNVAEPLDVQVEVLGGEGQVREEELMLRV